MTPSFRAATAVDGDLLLSMMREYYAADGLSFDPARAGAAVRALLSEEGNGRAWIIVIGGEAAGYFVLTRGFSLEFGGAFGLLDELCVREEYRGKGVGGAALAFLKERCREESYGALRLEVETHNAGAARLYAREGFHRHDRSLMTHWLLPESAS
jgi:GNAT superfamily N-acetyltransferase